MLLQRRLQDYDRLRIYDSIPEIEETQQNNVQGVDAPWEKAPEEVKATSDPELDKIIELAGYDYDQPQDIFYSVLNPWQRNVGYCRLYDEAAAPLGMIMDCEPIYFDYDNRKWMISFWKGQYDLVCGSEVGIYTGGLQLNIPDIFSGTFYNSVNDEEMLPISYTLKKNGKTLFTRSDRHWWLTGFKLGEFAQPSELTLETSLTFPNSAMRDAFLGGFKEAGYQEHEYTIDGNTVSFVFDTPHTPQPTTRTPATDEIIQEKNRLLCEMYQNLTREGQSTPEKLKILKKEAPELYDQALKLGANQQFFQVLYVLIITAMYLLTAFSSGSSRDKNYLSRKKDEILKKLKQKIEKLPVR